MDHISVSRLLAVYALGACEPAEIEPIETHIRQCPSCDREAQPLKGAAAWLRASPVTLPPASLRARVLQQAENTAAGSTGETARPDDRIAPRRWRGTRWLRCRHG